MIELSAKMGCHGTTTNRVTRGASDLPLGGMQAKFEILRIQRTKAVVQEKRALLSNGERSKNGDSGRSSTGLCCIPPIYPKAKVLLAKGHLHGTKR